MRAWASVRCVFFRAGLLLLLALVLGCGARLRAQCTGLVGTPIPASPYSVPAGGVTNASLAFGLNGTCSWSVQPSQSFVTFSSATSGVNSGAATVTFSVGVNTS